MLHIQQADGSSSEVYFDSNMVELQRSIDADYELLRELDMVKDYHKYIGCLKRIEKMEEKLLEMLS